MSYVQCSLVFISSILAVLHPDRKGLVRDNQEVESGMSPSLQPLLACCTITVSKGAGTALEAGLH